MHDINIDKLTKCSDTDGDQHCFMCKDNPNLCPNRDENGDFAVKILLTTEDNVNIQVGDSVWWLRKPNATVVNKELFAWQYGQTKKMESPDPAVFLYFSVYANLREYVVKEKPNITLDDMCMLFNVDRQIAIEMFENKCIH